jgi:hypothetical protein
MIKLTFNTTDKTAFVDFVNQTTDNYLNVPTVQVREGYYELMQRDDNGKSLPILRLPINHTIMFIEN